MRTAVELALLGFFTSSSYGKDALFDGNAHSETTQRQFSTCATRR